MKMKNSTLLMCILSNILQIISLFLIYSKFGEYVFILTYGLFTVFSIIKVIIHITSSEEPNMNIVFFLIPTFIVWLWLKIIVTSFKLLDDLKKWLDTKNQIIK